MKVPSKLVRPGRFQMMPRDLRMAGSNPVNILIGGSNMEAKWNEVRWMKQIFLLLPSRNRLS